MSPGFGLPDGWRWSTIEELAEVGTGTTPSRSQNAFWNKGNVPWITSSAVNQPFVTEADQFVTAEALAQTTLKMYPATTLIIALYGEGKTRGKVSELTFDATINQALAAVELRLEDQSHRGFVKHFLHGNYSALRRQAAGGMQPNLNLGLVKRIAVPLAPLPEQRRIVAKIEELFSDLDAGVAALERARANLKRYRASVLKAAVEGELTADWRARHPPAEPASALLQRILKERRAKWEADQLAKFAAAGKTPPKDWQKKYVEPTPPDTTGLPKLPEGWCWASVQQVGTVQLGRQRAPQHHTGPHMRPYLRVANVFEDRIDTDDVMQMNFTPEEYETYRLSAGDILLNEGQSMELVGRPAMYRDEVPGACFTNTLVRFRSAAGVSTDFALKVFLAYLKNGRFQKIATITVNIAHLGAGRFAEIEFPLPSEEEQAAIVAEVDRHLTLIDAAEKAINHGLQRAARLRQSILKQAFEGKLVPQDPTDEPASVLLERIAGGKMLNKNAVASSKGHSR